MIYILGGVWWFLIECSRATEMGIKLLKPMTTGRAHVCHLESLNTTFALIQNAIPQGEKDRGAFCQLILVIVDGHRSPLYNEIKYFGDIEKGVPVQVVNYYPLQQSAFLHSLWLPCLLLIPHLATSFISSQRVITSAVSNPVKDDSDHRSIEEKH